MKVFHIITSFDIGGAERIAINIAGSPNKEFEYHLIEIVRGHSKFTEDILKELKHHRIIYHKAPFAVSNKIAIILFPFWFLLLVLRQHPQIIHTHTEVPDLSIFIFYKLFGWIFPKTKYVRTIHNTVLWNNWKATGAKVEQFFKKKNANIAISLSTQQCYKKEYGKEVPIVYNGVEILNQKTYKNIVKGKINVLFAGRLEFQKGIDELIEVIKNLENIDIYVFHVVGNGSLQKKVQTQLIKFKNVILYDKIYGLSHYMGSFDYIFMPSNFEGLALTSIEASFAKTPVIANDCLGLNETLPHNWPLLVKNNDVSQYLHLFKETIPNLNRSKLGNITYNFARKNFSLENMRNGYETFYRQ